MEKRVKKQIKMTAYHPNITLRGKAQIRRKRKTDAHIE